MVILHGSFLRKFNIKILTLEMQLYIVQCRVSNVNVISESVSALYTLSLPTSSTRRNRWGLQNVTVKSATFQSF
jgi:hypothetical protein